VSPIRRLLYAGILLVASVLSTPSQSAAPAPQPEAAQPAQAAPAPAAVVAPSTVELSFFVSTDVNPDASGRASPVIVRIYELRSVAAFNATDFFSLFDKEKDVLGGELLVRDELPLMPGGTPQAIKNLRSETRYLGIVAAFRDIERARWRASTPVLRNQATRMDVKLDQSQVSIAIQ
jgi:type VI secretion system protein VasD